MDATSHESDEALELYALKRLPDSDVIKIEEHLLVCDSCRDRLEETANYALAMREALRREWKSQPAAAHRAAWFAWMIRPQFAFAGAVAVALLAVALVWNGHAGIPAVATLQLTAMRGQEVPSVSSSRELDLTLEDAPAAAPNASVEVVRNDNTGEKVWTGRPEAAGTVTRVKIPVTLSKGEYLARFYDSPVHILHEYAFRVK